MLPGSGSEKSEFSTWHTDYIESESAGEAQTVRQYYQAQKSLVSCVWLAFMSGRNSETLIGL